MHNSHMHSNILFRATPQESVHITKLAVSQCRTMSKVISGAKYKYNVQVQEEDPIFSRHILTKSGIIFQVKSYIQ